MKRIYFILLALIPMLMQAGVIMKHSGERLEDVTIKSVTDSEIVYELNGQELSIPKTDVSAIFYDDGRYEEIKQCEKPLSTYYEYDRNGLFHLYAAFLDEKYPKECRKEGRKVYNKVFRDLYQPALKEAKKSGFSLMEAMQQAMDKAVPPAVEASDKVVRECAGEL